MSHQTIVLREQDVILRLEPVIVASRDPLQTSKIRLPVGGGPLVFCDENDSLLLTLDVNGNIISEKGFVELSEQAAPAVSAAGKSRLYMDSGTNTVLLSENGGAYAPIGGGGVSDPITVNGWTPASGVATITGDLLHTSFLETAGRAAPAVAPAGKSRLYFDSGLNQLLISEDAGAYVRVVNGSNGDVIGPGASTDDALVRWNGATGALVADSNAILNDAGDLTLVGDVNLLSADATNDTAIESPALTLRGSFDSDTGGGLVVTDSPIFMTSDPDITPPGGWLQHILKIDFGGTGSFTRFGHRGLQFSAGDYQFLGPSQVQVARFKQSAGHALILSDNAGAERLEFDAAVEFGTHAKMKALSLVGIRILPNIGDGASAVGLIIDNLTSLSTTGSAIMSVRNAGNQTAKFEGTGQIRLFNESDGKQFLLFQTGPNPAIRAGDNSTAGEFLIEGVDVSSGGGKVLRLKAGGAADGANFGGAVTLQGGPAGAGARTGACNIQARFTKVKSDFPDGSSADALIVETTTTWANASARLLSVRNLTTERFAVGVDGGIHLLANQAVLTDNSTLDSPSITLRGFADTDAGAGITATARDTTIETTVEGTGTLGPQLKIKRGAGEFYFNQQGLYQGSSSSGLFLQIGLRSASGVYRNILSNSASGTHDIEVSDSGGTPRIRITPDLGGFAGIQALSNNLLILQGNKSDAASAVGIRIDNATTLSTAGAKILSVRNNTVEKFFVDKDGGIGILGDLDHDGSNVGFYGSTPVAQSSAYARNATIVEDRTLLASASATTLNNNNVLAALIADFKALGLLA